MEYFEKGKIFKEYLSELITAEELDRHEKERYAKVFNHDFMVSFGNELVIDATYVAGVARFADHSGNASAVLEVKLRVKGGNVVVLRAQRDINIGDPIELDYNFEDWRWYARCNCGYVHCRKSDAVVLK